MSGVERVGYVDADAEKPIEFESGAVDEVLQSAAFHVLHDQKGAAVLFTDVVDRADVGMIQCRGGFGFAAETLQGGGILGKRFGKKFDGDKAFKARVLRLVDNAHASTTEMFKDAVVGNGLADEGIAAGHLQHILGWVERQVNEGRNG